MPKMDGWERGSVKTIGSPIPPQILRKASAEGETVKPSWGRVPGKVRGGHPKKIFFVLL